ncbi:MAG: ferredoxin [Rhodocyclaceae bacterium]|nr:ferredoxin [Rhodocyclaceae bacterium]
MKHWRISLTGGEGETVAFDCPEGVSIHAAARTAGFRLRVACGSGGCGICAAELVNGQVDYVSPISAAKIEGCPARAVFLCRATPTEDCCIKTDWQWAVVDKAPLSRRMAINQQGK